MTRPSMARSGAERWWEGAVFYQVYPRSFLDTDGDGVGDLRGVIEGLDHLAWLGVDAVWLNPIHPSPNADWGYDASDYLGVHPELGTLGTVDRLISEAGRRGIRILLDLVPNHTSDRHPWFLDARASRTARHRGWYVWRDPRPDGSPPNNWRSTFGGPAWTFDGRTGQYYLHNFLPQQPDLDWWEEEVREEFDRILAFWFERGVAGFRIDVAHGIVKDRELRDNPPADDDLSWIAPQGQRPVYNMHRPEVHDVLRRWRRIADAHHPPRVLIGETWVPDARALAPYYGRDDELHMGFPFAFAFSELRAEQLRSQVEAIEEALPAGSCPAWTASNHDIGRFPTRWCRGDERRIRCGLLILLTLRGAAFLYYGDEIGMTEVDVPRERLRDPVGIRGWPHRPGRDRARTPMRWTRGPGGGFTRPGVEPWLPIGDAGGPAVADQREDPGSVLHLCRDLIRLRREAGDLRTGSYASLPAPPGAWAWRRGRSHAVAVNLSGRELDVACGEATVLLGTDRGRDGERVTGAVRLRDAEGVVLRLRGPAGRG